MNSSLASGLIVNPKTGTTLLANSEAGLRILREMYLRGDDISGELDLSIWNRISPDGLIDRFKGDESESFAAVCDLGLLKSVLRHADVAYRLGTPLFDDSVYDIIMSIFERRSGLASGEGPGEIEVVESTRRQGGLPFLLPSLTKWVYGLDEPGAFGRWWNKYINDGIYCSLKLDGASVLYYRDLTTGAYKLFSRRGWDISYLLEHLKMPEIPMGIGVRGEMILGREIWQTKWSKAGYKLSRSAVAGQINGKPSSVNLELVKDFEFVVYSLMMHSTAISAKRDLIHERELMASWGFNVVPGLMINRSVEYSDAIQQFRQLLQRNKETSRWDIDGLVLASRYYEGSVGGSDPPSWMLAFKENQTEYLTKVIDIEWRISKTGVLKPRVAVAPVEFSDGKTVSFVTGHNAKYINDNGIGPGAIVVISNRGEVIPGLIGVKRPADTVGLPEEGSYTWRGVDICPVGDNLSAESTGSDLVSISPEQMQIVFFMKSIGARHVGPALVAKMWDIGYVNLELWIRLVAVWIAQHRQTTGMEAISSRVGATVFVRALESISDALSSCSAEAFMAGTGILGVGIGERRLVELIKQYPSVWDKIHISQSEVELTSGFSSVYAKKVAENWPKWVAFWNSLAIKPGFIRATIDEEPESAANNDARISGKQFYITNGKADDINSFILVNGGIIAGGMRSNLEWLIDNSNGTKHNTKVEQARKLNKYISASDFRKTFMGIN